VSIVLPAPITAVGLERRVFDVLPTALSWTDMAIGCARIGLPARSPRQCVR
jgi:hypothetical protein